MKPLGLVVSGLLLISIAACSDDADDPTPAPTATTSSGDPAREIAQAEGLPQIDVDGIPGSSVSWRVPDDTTPGSPVGVAQRFAVLDQLAGSRGADFDPALATSVATEDGALSELRLRLTDPSRQDAPLSNGRLWVWLDEPEIRGANARVAGCADVGYFQPDGTTTPVANRHQYWAFELKQVDDVDDQEVWKVVRFGTGPTRPDDAIERDCKAWATHTP